MKDHNWLANSSLLSLILQLKCPLPRGWRSVFLTQCLFTGILWLLSIINTLRIYSCWQKAAYILYISWLPCMSLTYIHQHTYTRTQTQEERKAKLQQLEANWYAICMDTKPIQHASASFNPVVIIRLAFIITAAYEKKNTDGHTCLLFFFKLKYISTLKLLHSSPFSFPVPHSPLSISGVSRATWGAEQIT